MRVGMVNICESVIKAVIVNKPKRLTGLSQKGAGGGMSLLSV